MMIQKLTEEEKQAFVKLLEQPDPVLYAWLMQYEVPQDPQDKMIVQKIQLLTHLTANKDF